MHSYLLHNLLADSAKRNPGKRAVVLYDKFLTYSDLERKSTQVASTLSRLGVKKGDRVGLMLNKSIESIICVFGILKAGASYVPIDPLAPISRAAFIITNCEVECLIASSQNLKKFTNDSVGLSVRKALVLGSIPKGLEEENKASELIQWEEVFDEYIDDHHEAEITDDYPAYILHTSGSTGSPKGVAISHLNSLTFVNMAREVFNINQEDRLANYAPLHFDLSVFDIYVSVKCGATIVIIPEFLSTFPVRLAEYINEKHITVWNSVSSVLSMLAERGGLEKFPFNSLRMVHFSGDIMPVKYLRILKERMPTATFYNIYGQTEANSSMAYNIRDIKDDMRKIPIGKPFPNFEVFAINEKGEVITGPNEIGELYIRSSTVALGYWGDKEKTRNSFVTDPRNPLLESRVYKTGDIVKMKDDGNYVFVGRKDNMVKSRGYRIELNEIEITLSSHPCVRQAAVIAIPDELFGNRIIAYVSVGEDKKVKEKELLNYCSNLLPKYMIPEGIEYHDKLPTTSSGKIDKEFLKNEALSKCSKKARCTD